MASMLGQSINRRPIEWARWETSAAQANEGFWFWRSWLIWLWSLYELTQCATWGRGRANVESGRGLIQELAYQIDQSLSGNYASKYSHSPIWENVSGFPRNSLDVCVPGIKLNLNRKKWVDTLHLTMHRKPKWNRWTTLGDQILRGTCRVAWTITRTIADSWTVESAVRISKTVAVDACPSP
jgi:hypothetical protein